MTGSPVDSVYSPGLQSDWAREKCMRTIVLYAGIFALAGLSLLASHLIVAYVPRPPAIVVEAPSGQGSSNRLLFIALALVGVVGLVLVSKKDD